MKILPPVREDDKMLAGLTYPFWIVVVPFVMLSARREEPFVQFHARQSLWLGIGSVAATVLGAFLTWAFMAVMPAGSASGVLGLFAFAALWLVFLFMFFLFFFLGYRASTGEFYRLPVVGERALQRTMEDLGLSAVDLEEDHGAPRPVATSSGPRETPATPPPALSDLRPAPSVRTGPPLRPLPSAPRASDTRKPWDPSAVKPDPTNVLKRWLTDEEAKG